VKLSELEDTDNLATKDDLRSLADQIKDLNKDLKNFILEREIVAMRWMLGIQITYFFGTLAAVWFMITHTPK
jgi:hypothetical protein